MEKEVGRMERDTKGRRTKGPMKKKMKKKAGRVKKQQKIKIQAKTEAKSDEIEAK